MSNESSKKRRDARDEKNQFFMLIGYISPRHVSLCTLLTQYAKYVKKISDVMLYFLQLCLFLVCSVCETPLFASPSPDKEVEMCMKDGARLPASVFLPKDCLKNQTKVPCILVRAPLGKTHFDPNWFKLVDAGYGLIIQSTRTCCDPTGKDIPYVTDGKGLEEAPSDGYDSVQWIANQSFCNGSISTLGYSASGITQFLLAAAEPPQLTCQYIEMAPPSLYHYAIFPGGQLRKEQVEGWLKLQHRDSSVLDYLKTKKEDTHFWDKLNIFHNQRTATVPQMHLGGWYDIFLQGTIDAFLQAQSHSPRALQNQHRLIIGPWGHKWKMTNKLGPFTLKPEQKEPPFPITEHTWLDYHVRHIKNGLETSPIIQYYVMGPVDGSNVKGNEWRTSDRWPPKNITPTRYHLGDSSSLSTTASKMTPKEITFHPNEPVPTIGGRNLFLPEGPFDISPLLKRDDVFLYSTPPLEEEIEITGPVTANLYISHDKKERDVSLRLIDIYPTGEKYLIAEGYTHMPPQKKDKPQPVAIDLWSTSMVFAKGHSIGLLISASNFPSYETSLDPSDQDKNSYTIFSSPPYPSYILLPIAK